MKSLYNKYEGKTIALVGSGPTALSFNEEEDVAIAINGAIQLDKHFNYLCMFDTSLPQKTWFYDKPEVQRLVGSELAGMYSIDSSTCVFQYEGVKKN